LHGTCPANHVIHRKLELRSGQEYPQVKILALSAQADNQDALLTAKLFGADAILQDALDGEELVNAVTRLVGGP
jgi:hypothetical protein